MYITAYVKNLHCNNALYSLNGVKFETGIKSSEQIVTLFSSSYIVIPGCQLISSTLVFTVQN